MSYIDHHRLTRDFTLGAFRRHPDHPTEKSGLQMPFAGKPVILYPVIGSAYLCHVEGFDPKDRGSLRRPMILVGYYTHNGKTVACDFIAPSTRNSHPGENRFADDRYALFPPNLAFAGFSSKNSRIDCGNIITLPNNPDCILKSLPIGKLDDSLLADYLLRRVLVLHEQKARWRKDALIPEGAVREGFVIDGILQSECVYKNRCLPDVAPGRHDFSQVSTGPRFIADHVDKIVELGRKIYQIQAQLGIDIDLPELGTFASWPSPRHLLPEDRSPWMRRQAFG